MLVTSHSSSAAHGHPMTMTAAVSSVYEWMNERMNEWMTFLLTCDKKLTTSLKASLVLYTRQLKDDNGKTKT